MDKTYVVKITSQAEERLQNNCRKLSPQRQTPVISQIYFPHPER